MSNVFPRADDWEEQFRRRRRRHLSVCLVWSALILAVCLYIGGTPVLVAASILAVYWVVELFSKFDPSKSANFTVEVTPTHLVQNLQLKDKPASLSIPWHALKVTRIKSVGTNVTSIQVRDMRPGRHGFGSFLDHKITGFRDMNILAQEIQRRVACAAA